jgi:serine/threonine-protein kinase
MIGKRLDGRYEIEALIGVGGMANVYKAKDLLENRAVAVKILRDEFMSATRSSCAASRTSPRPSRCSRTPTSSRSTTSAFSDKVLQYIAMEYLDGVTLKDYIIEPAEGPLAGRRRCTLSPRRWRPCSTPTTRASSTATSSRRTSCCWRDGSHQGHGLRHRALLAQPQNPSSEDKAIGSVHYISPEQARARRSTPAPIIYSTGVMMYEMLTGGCRLRATTPVSIALQHINSMALPPSALMDGVPEKLEAITMKAMNPVLSKRYSSAAELLEDLEDFRNDLKIDVDIPSAMPKSDPPDPTVPIPEEQNLDATRRLHNTGEVPEGPQPRGTIRKRTARPARGRRSAARSARP